MSPVPPVTCTHDLGPGTTVCLRCRNEQRQEVRARRQRLLALGGAAALGLVGIYAVAASAASAWHAAPRQDQPGDTPRVFSSADVKQQGDSKAPAAPAVQLTAPASAPATAPVATSPAVPTAPVGPAPVAAPLALLVPQGRTDLPGSVIAQRTGDSVIVDFDTQFTRTRRRDKFERVLRGSLPLLYGAPVDSILRAIPDGGIVGDSDLLTELPARGIHLPLADGWTLDVWPETRPGQDGPLVVSYRARVTR